jgi:hypothetical protein
MKNKTYKIIRFYRNSDHKNHMKIMKRGLSLAEAQQHCQDERTKKCGVWFDGYGEEKV